MRYYAIYTKHTRPKNEKLEFEISVETLERREKIVQDKKSEMFFFCSSSVLPFNA